MRARMPGPRAAHARADPRRAAQGGAAAGHRERARRRDAAAAARGDDARAAAARARLPGAHRPRRGAAAVAVRRGGARGASAAEWEEREEELFGPAETLHVDVPAAARRAARRRVAQVGGRLGELRFDTDLDVSHAVVRYLELLKLAALLERTRAERAARPEALPEVNARLLQAATAEQREIFETSRARRVPARRRARRAAARARAVAARDEPSLEPFLPRARRRAGAVSASDIETYRTCPLKYKFARVFRIPQRADAQPALRDPRPPGARALPRAAAPTRGAARAARAARGRLAARRLRRLRGGAPAARQGDARRCVRYHERFQDEDGEPVWFERSFPFRLGPHLLRGRVDRVDRLPDGGYELIDYKTGRPKTAGAAARGRPALALRGRRARGVAARGRRSRPTTTCSTTRRCRSSATEERPRLDHRDRARGRRGDPGAGLRADAVVRGVLDLRLPDRLPGGRALDRGVGRGSARRSRPRWRRKRWNSRASTSPDGQRRSGRAAVLLVSAACSRRSTNAWTSGSHLDGARDLALVVGRGVLELGGVDGDADQALEPAHQRERAPSGSARRRRSAGPPPTGARTAARPRRRRRAARRRSRSGPRRSSGCRPSRSTSAASDAMPGDRRPGASAARRPAARRA